MNTILGVLFALPCNTNSINLEFSMCVESDVWRASCLRAGCFLELARRCTAEATEGVDVSRDFNVAVAKPRHKVSKLIEAAVFCPENKTACLVKSFHAGLFAPAFVHACGGL